MISRSEYEKAREWAWEFVKKTGLPLHDAEFDNIEVADLGFGDLEKVGLQILTLASTEWLGAKLLILKPHQFFPQHRHPPSSSGDYPGKTEVFRGQYGAAYLYVDGEPSPNPSVLPPEERREHCSVWHEVPLLAGDQYIAPPDTWHWFQAGPEGAVVWSLSSKVTDSEDQFSDPAVVRKTVIRD